MVVGCDKEGTLYMTINSKDCIDIVGAINNVALWHCRIGHMSEK